MVVGAGLADGRGHELQGRRVIRFVLRPQSHSLLLHGFHVAPAFQRFRRRRRRRQRPTGSEEEEDEAAAAGRRRQRGKFAHLLGSE